MSSGTRSQEKKRREDTAATEELPPRSITPANTKLMIKGLNHQFNQMMSRMNDLTTQMRHINANVKDISIRLEKMKNSFITVAFITNASAPHQSASHIMTASISHIMPASASAIIPASAPAQMNSQLRWRSEEIGKFDSISRDVVEFIDRIRNIALLRGQHLVVTNLVTLLTEQAKMWYNYGLLSFFKMIMQQKLIDQWINALLTRFTLSKSETLQVLEKQRYIRQNAVNKRNLVKYLHDVLQLIKRFEYFENEDLIMTYLRLNEILQMQFSSSHEIVSISNMMTLLNIKKDAWY